MKTLFTVILCLFLLAKVDESMAQWVQQSSGTTHSIRSVYFDKSNRNRGLITTASGEVISTQTGGANWNSQVLTNGSALEDILFTDSLNGIAVGAFKLYKTNDAGSNWVLDTGITTQAYWQRIFFINQLEGWIVGSVGKIIHTLDGGLSWNDLISGNQYNFNSCYFTSSLNGFVVGDFGTILKTTDGGLTWQNIIVNGLTQDITDVVFTDTLNGFIVGDFGVIYHTTDGGVSWSFQTSNTTNLIRSVCFTDNLRGWACGDNGIVLFTTNAGNSWAISPSNTQECLFQIKFVNDSIGYVVGDAGLILYTSNSAATGIEMPNSVNKMIKIYPNPAIDHVTIDFGSEWNTLTRCSIELKNYLGQTIYNYNENQQYMNLDLSTLTGNGVYLYTVKSDSGAVISTGKFIVNK